LALFRQGHLQLALDAYRAVLQTHPEHRALGAASAACGWSSVITPGPAMHVCARFRLTRRWHTRIQR
jgi:hypothetical protein